MVVCLRLVGACRLVLALAVLTVLAVPARGRAKSARELLDKARTLNDTTRHWTDRTQTVTLVITDPRGGERRRELRVFNKRYPNDEDKSLSVFLVPAEVKGTGFLQWGHKREDADQWLYLPDLNRTRRITSLLREESFMGTDFTYRDLEIVTKLDRWTEEEAPSKLLREEPVADVACQVIELRPKLEGTPYARLVLWLDPELIPRRLDFFKEEDPVTKTLTFDRIENVGSIPTPRVLDIRNVVKGSHTRLEVSDVKYDAGLSDDIFTQRQLERGAP